MPSRPFDVTRRAKLYTIPMDWYTMEEKILQVVPNYSLPHTINSMTTEDYNLSVETIANILTENLPAEIKQKIKRGDIGRPEYSSGDRNDDMVVWDGTKFQAFDSTRGGKGYGGLPPDEYMYLEGEDNFPPAFWDDVGIYAHRLYLNLNIDTRRKEILNNLTFTYGEGDEFFGGSPGDVISFKTSFVHQGSTFYLCSWEEFDICGRINGTNEEKIQQVRKFLSTAEKVEIEHVDVDDWTLPICDNKIFEGCELNY